MHSCQQLALVLLLLLLDLVVVASRLLQQLEAAAAGAAVQRGSALRWLSPLTSSQSEYAALLHAQHTAQHSTAQHSTVNARIHVFLQVVTAAAACVKLQKFRVICTLFVVNRDLLTCCSATEIV
jgi:hypothetical protein